MTMERRCHVRHEEREVVMRFSVDDAVEALLHAAIQRFEEENTTPGFDRKAMVGLRSLRLGKDLFLEACVDELVKDDDVLEMRPYTVTPPSASVQDSTLPSDGSLTMPCAEQQNALGMVLTPPGLFVLQILQVEHRVLASRLGPSRLVIEIQLRPYQGTAKMTHRRGASLSDAPFIRFRHFDESKKNIHFHLVFFKGSILGPPTCCGMTKLSIDKAMSTPGLASQEWCTIESSSPGDLLRLSEPGEELQRDELCGRALISVSYHPSVRRGPTVSKLLRELTQNHGDADYPWATSSHSWHTRIFNLNWNKYKSHKDFRPDGSGARYGRPNGKFSFQLRGIHICGAQCSSSSGHTSASFPDFDPILIVRFGEDETEMRSSKTDCNFVTIERMWPVYSSFARVDVEIFQKLTFTTNHVRRLEDGSMASKHSELSISCHDILEFEAASLTCDPPSFINGPGQHPVESGFRWYPLLQGDDEVGLACIHAEYTEDLIAVFNAEESEDLRYVHPDEQDFDPSIVLHHFERLDELFASFRAVQRTSKEILEWKHLLRTFFVWICISLFCWYIPLEQVPTVLCGSVIVFLSMSFYSFMTGKSRQRWIYRARNDGKMRKFRPMASIRIVPVEATGLNKSGIAQYVVDAFVRIVYEPNFKDLPAHVIALSECASQSTNASWSSPQPDSISSKRQAKARKNMHFRSGLVQHTTSYTHILPGRSSVEPWPRSDGSVDTLAFKMQILQPDLNPGSREDDELVPWENVPGMIRFDVLQLRECGQGTLIGRRRVPVKSLVSDETRGGEQEEWEDILPLHVPHPNNSSERMVPTATLKVRMQLILRDPSKPVTLQEKLASEAFYEATEMESDKNELSWVEKYHKARNVAISVQQTLGEVCSTAERLKNLFLWVHPRKTLLVYIATVLAVLWFYFVPFRYMVICSIARLFTQRFHKVSNKDHVLFQNFLVSIPSDVDMKRIYARRNLEYLRQQEHAEAQTKLEAVWTGHVWRQATSGFRCWQERYCAVRGGHLEFWQSISDARAGLPPKVGFAVVNAIDKCTKAECSEAPRNSYPFAIFEVNPRLLRKGSRPKRRLLSLKTEEDFHALIAAIRSTGECLGS